MGKRRKAREAAIQYHFWRDLQHGDGPEQIGDFWEFCPATPRVREFAQPLIEGMVGISRKLTNASGVTSRITNSNGIWRSVATSCGWPSTKCLIRDTIR